MAKKHNARDLEREKKILKKIGFKYGGQTRLVIQSRINGIKPMAKAIWKPNLESYKIRSTSITYEMGAWPKVWGMKYPFTGIIYPFTSTPAWFKFGLIPSVGGRTFEEIKR